MGCPIALDTSQWRYHDPLPLSLSRLDFWRWVTRFPGFARSTFSFLLRPAETRDVWREGRRDTGVVPAKLAGWLAMEDEKTRSNQELGREGGRERVCVWRSRVHWPKIILACRAVVPRRPPSIPVTSHRFHASSSSLFPSFLLVEISW